MSSIISIEFFDALSYLKDNGIPYTEANNGWINVPCVFGCDDHFPYHLGIHLEEKTISCWMCGTTGKILKYLIVREGSFLEAKKVLQEYSNHTASELTNIVNKLEKRYAPRYKLPSEFKQLTKDYLPKEVSDFLNRRGFLPSSLLETHCLYYPAHLGNYKFRLIIPVYLRGHIVSFVGRDVTDESKKPYMMPNKEDVPIHPKDTLYGFDDLSPGDTVVIVEGVIDQWKLGKGSVATFGTSFTKSQIELLKSIKPNRVFIWFDSEEPAQKAALKLASKIWFSEVEVVELKDYKDPGELSVDNGKRLLKELIGGN